MQDDGPDAARRGPRGDPRRRVQPHGGVRPHRPDACAAAGGTTPAGTATTPTAPTRTPPAAATRSTCDPTPNRGWSSPRCGAGSTSVHVDGFRFDLATTLLRGDAGVDLAAPFLAEVAADPVLSALQADRRTVGRRAGRLPARRLPRAVVGVERPLPQHRARHLARSDPDAAGPRHPAGRQRRPVRGHGSSTVGVDQLRDRPRRVHPRRPRGLRAQAQRRQRRRRRGRHRRQPLVELRRRGSDRRPDRAGVAVPPAAEPAHDPARLAGARRCWSRATSSAGRSRATTTPTRRTTRCRGSTGPRRTKPSIAFTRRLLAVRRSRPSLRADAWLTDDGRDLAVRRRPSARCGGLGRGRPARW